MVRNDSHYIGVRMTEEERTAYDKKLSKTNFTGKLFLSKLLDGEALREKAPIWAGQDVPAEQAKVYYARYHYLEKCMADISSIVYLAHLWKNE